MDKWGKPAFPLKDARSTTCSKTWDGGGLSATNVSFRGYDIYPTTGTVETFIHNLRRKIEKKPSRPAYILTIPGMGYKFHK